MEVAWLGEPNCSVARAVQDKNGRALADDGEFDRALGRFDNGTVRFQSLDLAIPPAHERRRAYDGQDDGCDDKDSLEPLFGHLFDAIAPSEGFSGHIQALGRVYITGEEEPGFKDRFVGYDLEQVS